MSTSLELSESSSDDKESSASELLLLANEITEGTMLHTKAIATQDTAGWERACRGEGHQTCRIGVPHPEDDEHKKENKDGDGWVYNCYVNQVVENKWVPGLEKSMGLKR